MPIIPRYQVFISSTYTDLVEERQALISALLQLRALPAGMELFPAADEEAWGLIKRVIDESDYYLLVIGGRYGSLDKDGVGFTEKEYDYATNQKKPIMAFLHGNPEELPLRSSEGAPEAREKLNAFRRKVESAKHVKFWNSSEDLAGKVALSFATFTSMYPAVGWVPADSGDSAETLAKLAAAQERVEQLEKERVLEAHQPPEGAVGLADGDEKLEVSTAVQATIRNLTYESDTAQTQHRTFKGELSWNEILFSLGPLLLDEASQEALWRRFGTLISGSFKDYARTSMQSWLDAQIPKSHLLGYDDDTEESKLKVHFQNTISANREDFETAVLQLEALGLIERGKKKRTVSDRQTYWTLTPWGRTRLTQLRAVRTGQSKPPALELDLDTSPVSD